MADVEVAEAADQAEAVKLAGLFLEAADEQHLLIEMQELFLGRLVALVRVQGFLEAVEREILFYGSGFYYRGLCFGQRVLPIVGAIVSVRAV
ncbi:hypothetical protein NRB_06160 [Novosphingobium sp. 11B]